MNKYKINFIYNESGCTLDEILIKTLKYELKNMICNLQSNDISSNCTNTYRDTRRDDE